MAALNAQDELGVLMKANSLGLSILVFVRGFNAAGGHATGTTDVTATANAGTWHLTSVLYVVFVTVGPGPFMNDVHTVTC